MTDKSDPEESPIARIRSIRDEMGPPPEKVGILRVILHVSAAETPDYVVVNGVTFTKDVHNV